MSDSNAGEIRRTAPPALTPSMVRQETPVRSIQEQVPARTPFMARQETPARSIQEQVPGRQITLAHIIANPDPALYTSLPAEYRADAPAIGIVNVTPPETVLIAADIAVKSAGVRIAAADRGSGALLITGSVSETEAAVTAALEYIGGTLGFAVCGLTKN